MTTHTQAQPLLNAYFDFNRSTESLTRTPINPAQQPYHYPLRRSQRLAKQRRAKSQVRQTMASNSTSTNSSSSKKTTISIRKWKQTKAALRPPMSRPSEPKPSDPAQPASHSIPSDQEEPSLFEAMTQAEQFRAFSFYYDHPHALPYRESGAIRRADDPTEVLVKFDEGIFSRKKCLRPLSEDDLESVDPFTLDNVQVRLMQSRRAA